MDPRDRDLCEEKHKSITDELKRLAKWLGDHEHKLDDLEKSDASNTIQIKTLVTSMNGLTKALWGLALTIGGALLGGLLGFLIWYIQSL